MQYQEGNDPNQGKHHKQERSAEKKHTSCQIMHMNITRDTVCWSVLTVAKSSKMKEVVLSLQEEKPRSIRFLH